MKTRVYKQQKKEEYLGLNQTANNYVIGSYITIICLLHANENTINTILSSSLHRAENDPQGSNHAVLQSVDTTGPGNAFILAFTLHKQYGDRVVLKVMFYVPTGSASQRPMITPRHLPFTMINKVAHYDNVEHIGSPFSCILQGITQNIQTTTLLLPPFHNITMSRFININMNVENARMTYIVKRREYL
uniref:Uncharacterized protein n=1 Tax=Oryza barthii TaxID=65489 RepID=A0A0D3GQC2_9ORYZ